jgi:transcription initiation factor TFIIE subunit alpha
MKLSNKVIEDVIIEVVGEDGLPLVKILKNKKNVSEFKIAEKMGLEVNIIRNKLYRLYHSNLVSFIRRKDRKKGWYIYYWTFKLKRIKHLMAEIKRNRLIKLKDRLEREKNNQFFICDSKCMRLNFERAFDFEFKCPECGQLMNQEDNKEKIKKIEADIKQLEKEIKTK